MALTVASSFAGYGSWRGACCGQPCALRPQPPCAAACAALARPAAPILEVCVTWDAILYHISPVTVLVCALACIAFAWVLDTRQHAQLRLAHQHAMPHRIAHILACALARLAFAWGPNMCGAIFMRLLWWGWSRNLMTALLCQLLPVSQ